MKEDQPVPELFREAFKKYSLLQSEAEKEAFWREIVKYAEEVPPHILKEQFKEGVLTLSSKVQALHDKVKDKMPA